MTETEALTALGTVLDPEVGIDIVNLGLVADLTVDSSGVTVHMIMTSAACPMHGHLINQAETALRRIAAAGQTVAVSLVQEPAWTPERMSDEARQTLGW